MFTYFLILHLFLLQFVYWISTNMFKYCILVCYNCQIFQKLSKKQSKTARMTTQAEYQQILQLLQRPINCLADQDRNTRKSGLDTIRKQLQLLSKQYCLKLFNQTKLTALLSKTFADIKQQNRQLSLTIFSIFIKKCQIQGRQIYQLLLPPLIARLNSKPFVQPTEQVRLLLINTFITITPFKDPALKNITQLCNVTARCLEDDWDMLKQSACKLAKQLSTHLGHDMGRHTVEIVKALNTNLNNQKFKVRKNALETLPYVLLTEGAGGNFQHVRGLKNVLITDKKKQVRVSGFECVSQLLLRFGPKYMREYQAELTGFLIIGLDDGEKEIVERVKGLLEKCGDALKEEERGNGKEGEMIGE